MPSPPHEKLTRREHEIMDVLFALGDRASAEDIRERLSDPPGYSAVRAMLPGSRVVAAFHHVSAVLLLDPEVDTIDLDVLVLGDDREATDLVQALAARIPGVRGIYAGRLRNCGQIEALTANLVSINRRYKAHAGLRVTDI